MSITHSGTLADHEIEALVAQVAPVVNEEIALATVASDWGVSLDARGRTLLTLRLKDAFGGQATADFAPDELRQDWHLRERLHDLKGALLRVGRWNGTVLPALYRDIRTWIGALAHPVLVRDTELEVQEHLSGRYVVPALNLLRGNRTIEIVPVAIWVVGAEGRVDVKGDNDGSMLILNGKNWSIVDPADRHSTRPLEKETFCQLVEDLLT